MTKESRVFGQGLEREKVGFSAMNLERESWDFGHGFRERERELTFIEGWELLREGLNGGLLLSWIPKQRLHISYESKHLVHTDLLDNRGNPLFITFVHSSPNHSKREVWDKLRSLKLIAHPNWLYIGDFNQISNYDDKFSFHQGSISRVESFQQVIANLALCELTSSGQKFTWMNRREKEDFVMEKVGQSL